MTNKVQTQKLALLSHLLYFYRNHQTLISTNIKNGIVFKN